MAAEKKENALMKDDIQRKKRVAMRERACNLKPQEHEASCTLQAELKSALGENRD